MADPVRPGREMYAGKRGRPSPLDDPEFAKSVGEAFADGMSRSQMCELFGVKDKDTITKWRKDPRVKAYAMRLIEDRVVQVTRRVDAAIAGRLQNTSAMTIKELLMIRKEFLSGALRAQTEAADEATVAEAMQALEENPDLMRQLDEMLSGKDDLPGVD